MTVSIDLSSRCISMQCEICLDEDPGKFNICAFLFLRNELNSYIRILLGILYVNINVLWGDGCGCVASQ